MSTETAPSADGNQQLTAELEATLHEYGELWNSQDVPSVIALWDTDDQEPFYLAEEQDDWRIGWEEVKSYWGPPGPSSVQSVRMVFDSVRARWLSDDLAFAKFWIRFDTKMTFMPKPIGSDARASAIFRKTEAGWRLVTWAESPGTPILYIHWLYKMHGKEGESSPMPYLSELYERHTRDDFAEYMKDHYKEENKST